jgi:uncharacterized delta-60 repeat protein
MSSLVSNLRTSLALPSTRPRPVHRVVLSLLSATALLGLQFAVASPADAKAGSLDRAFGVGGTVTTDFAGAGDVAAAVAVQADGKLVAAGWANTAGPFSFNQDFALARYNSNGTLDTTFGTGGKVTTDFGTVQDEAFALAVQPDGKLVAAGAAGGPGDFALARYNPDGTLDTSFGTGGKVTTDFGGFDQVAAVAVQADGKLVAAGTTEGSSAVFALARYNPDGTLDTSFGTGGKVTTDFARPGGSFDQANGLVLQGSKLVAAGTAGPLPGFVFALARYRADGTLDPSFGSHGTVTTDFGGGTNEANALALQPDGKPVAAGFASTQTGEDFALARYLL